MLVWHIDQDMDYWVNNKVNTDPTHQRIDIIEADKKADTSTLKGDSFPGSEQVTQFDLYAWSGDKLTAFEDVTEENNTIYLLLAGTDFQPDAPNDIKVLESDDTSVTISWSPVKYAKYYLLTVADAISGEPVGTYNDKRLLSCDAVSIPYLEAEHEYVVTVKAGIGNYLSNPATQTVQTTAVPFAKLSPQNVEVSDVTSNSFLVKWDGVRDAESYVITLTRNQYPDNTVARGYGFDDKQNGLPAMWSTSSNSFYSVSGWYGVSSPSLRFSKDGDNIIAAYPESLITSISFWCRAKSAGQKIAVDVADGENGYEALDTVDVSENGGSVTVELPESSSVKLTYLRTENFIVIDDLTLNCKVLEREPVEAYTDFAVSGADGVLIDGLTAETTYGLTVRAVNSDVYSAKSEEAVVTLLADSGVDSVGMDDASVADRGESVYDLFGRKYRTLNSVAPGIYIVNGVKRIIK
jgi:hypothetical protein